VASTPTDGPAAPSGITVPPEASKSKGWNWFRQNRRRHVPFRVGVFTAGLVLILAGGAMWAVSALLALPPAFLGLWLWSREFHWGNRLFKAFVRRARSLWSRVKSRPVRWSIITAAGVAAAWAAYWAVGHYQPFGVG